MPTRNIVKQYGEDCYYHVYNRGVNKERIFRDADDYAVFLALFKRHLSKVPAPDTYGRPLPHYADQVDLVAYCLMPNHFHLLVFLKHPEGLEKLMRSTMTAYSMYFNKKYRRFGSLFQNHFLAALVDSDPYLWHVSRYIHLNPQDIGEDPLSYPFSSIGYFTGDKSAEWLHPELLVQTAEERREYLTFVKDYAALHEELANLKHQLAHNIEW